MPDLDPNEDPTRLSGAPEHEPTNPPEEQTTPPGRRVRSPRYGDCGPAQGRPSRRVGVRLLARRRLAARRACPDRAVLVLASPPRARRRLWTLCHGRPSGSSS